MEQFLANFGDPSIEVYTLGKPHRKEYNEPYNTATIVLCPIEMKIFNLILRSMMEQACFEPIPRSREASLEGQEKETNTKSSTQPL